MPETRNRLPSRRTGSSLLLPAPSHPTARPPRGRPMPSSPNRALVTVPEAARLLPARQSTVQRLIYAGELETVRVGMTGRGVRVTVRSIDAYIDRGAIREAAVRA